MHQTRPASEEQIIHMVTQHQRNLYCYIYSLVLDADDAQEVLQETNLTLWRKRAEIRDVANFSAWACRVAYYEVLSFRKRSSRDKHLFFFDDQLLANIAKEAETSPWQDARGASLSACLRKLPQHNLELIQLRYGESRSVKELSEYFQRSVAAISQSLYRVRKRLLDCVNRHGIAEAGQ